MPCCQVLSVTLQDCCKQYVSPQLFIAAQGFVAVSVLSSFRGLKIFSWLHWNVVFMLCRAVKSFLKDEITSRKLHKGWLLWKKNTPYTWFQYKYIDPLQTELSLLLLLNLDKINFVEARSLRSASVIKLSMNICFKLNVIQHSHTSAVSAVI